MQHFKSFSELQLNDDLNWNFQLKGLNHFPQRELQHKNSILIKWFYSENWLNSMKRNFAAVWWKYQTINNFYETIFRSKLQSFAEKFLAWRWLSGSDKLKQYEQLLFWHSINSFFPFPSFLLRFPRQSSLHISTLLSGLRILQRRVFPEKQKEAQIAFVKCLSLMIDLLF